MQTPQLKHIILNELFTIIDSHLQVFAMWKESQDKNKFNFESFLNCRRKRLCATMMLYCDSLMLKPSQLTEETLDKLRLIGEIYEIEVTLVRDLKKWTASAVDVNLYSYWLLIGGDFMKGEHAEMKQKFAREVLAIANVKKGAAFKGLDKHLLEQYRVIRNVIRNHYGVGEEILPLSADEIRPKL